MAELEGFIECILGFNREKMITALSNRARRLERTKATSADPLRATDAAAPSDEIVRIEKILVFLRKRSMPADATAADIAIFKRLATAIDATKDERRSE